MPTIIIVICLIIVAFRVLIFGKSKMKNNPVVADHEKILTLTDQNFGHQTKNKIVLIDFWANWCVPCRMMAPILNEVAAELSGNSYVDKVNIEQHQSLAQKFKVRSIPTLVLLKNGVEV